MLLLQQHTMFIIDYYRKVEKENLTEMIYLVKIYLYHFFKLFGFLIIGVHTTLIHSYAKRDSYVERSYFRVYVRADFNASKCCYSRDEFRSDHKRHNTEKIVCTVNTFR